MRCCAVCAVLCCAWIAAFSLIDWISVTRSQDTLFCRACRDCCLYVICKLLEHHFDNLLWTVFVGKFSWHLSQRALLQVCRISDTCLQIAGAVVKTASAPVLGQQHIADMNQLRADGVGLMHYMWPAFLCLAFHLLQHAAWASCWQLCWGKTAIAATLAKSCCMHRMLSKTWTLSCPGEHQILLYTAVHSG